MAKKEIQKLHFEASANLQRLIGRELVPNEEVALVELVKNSYDSGAKKVVITIEPPSQKDPGRIEVWDDGHGMTVEDLRRLFMVAGYSERPEQVSRSKRTPTGEKGIGRFASDKLGKTLTVITKRRGEDEGVQLDINWEAFRNKDKKFSDIHAPYKSVSFSETLNKESFTRLNISPLRNPWSSVKRESVRTALSGLLDPFRRQSDFEIDLQMIGSPKLSGPIRQERLGGADIEIEFRILKDGSVLRIVGGALASEDGERTTARLLATEKTRMLKGLSGHLFYCVNRATKTFSKGMAPGVRVYRDGFRIEPFGSPTADWLGISEKRAKRAGHAHIVPSRLFGFIEISRKEHPELIDTTSRQALIESEHARGLVDFLKEQIEFLEQKIREDFTEPKWKESKTRQAAAFEQARLQTLGIMSFGLAHELRQPLQVIRSEAGNITTRLEQLKIVDPDIRAAQTSIDRNIERIDENIKLIANISKGNAKEISTFDLAELVHNDCRYMETRCSAMGIELRFELPDKQMATTNSTTITNVLLNLLRNSMEALESSEIVGQRRQLIVSLSAENNEHILTVTDTGPGIAQEIQPKIFKKFATKKTGGMGVGLYYCNIMAQAHGGTIQFVTRENVGTTFTVRLPNQGG